MWHFCNCLSTRKSEADEVSLEWLDTGGGRVAHGPPWGRLRAAGVMSGGCLSMRCEEPLIFRTTAQGTAPPRGRGRCPSVNTRAGFSPPGPPESHSQGCCTCLEEAGHSPAPTVESENPQDHQIQQQTRPRACCGNRPGVINASLSRARC